MLVYTVTCGLVSRRFLESVLCLCNMKPKFYRYPSHSFIHTIHLINPTCRSSRVNAIGRLGTS